MFSRVDSIYVYPEDCFLLKSLLSHPGLFFMSLAASVRTSALTLLMSSDGSYSYPIEFNSAFVGLCGLSHGPLINLLGSASAPVDLNSM